MASKHVVTLALALTVVWSHPVELEGDQYASRQEHPHAVQLPFEATDSMPQVSGPKRPEYTKREINVDTELSSDANPGEAGRAKREFSSWSARHTQLIAPESFAMWKPPTYQLGRPYFIPVYGASGKMPIYFPPQPFNINPGTPLDNPLPNRPFTGPSYLPPKEYLPPVTTEKSTTMDISYRHDESEEDDSEEDDRPIWGNAPAPTTTQKPSNIIPTRAPRPPGLTAFPPLLHDVNNSGTNFLAAESEESSERNDFVPPPSQTVQRPAQTVQRPAQSFQRPIQSTPSPVRSTARPAGPSNCVWAIVSCCSVMSNEVPENCFEQRGCPGPFWGSSPCDDNNVRAAINAAAGYFTK